MAGKQQDAPFAAALDISNVVAAFSEDQAEKITGLSKRRLRYWASTDFFSPSFVEDNRRLPFSRFYSFKDIVALRALEILRVQKNVPLQQLRKVAEQLSHLKDHLWIQTTLFVVDRKVVVVNPQTGTPQEVASGQYRLDIIALKQVIEDTNTNVAELRRRPKESIGKIEKARAIARNAWAISGTRIPVGAIKRLHEDGYSVDQIIEEYPDLTHEDVDAALKHDESEAA